MIEETWLTEYVPLRGDIFIDVGANVCAWTKWLFPGYNFVHIIEPFKDAIDAAGVLPNNSLVHPVAAWSKFESIRFGVYSPSKLLFAQEDIDSFFAEIGSNGPVDENSLTIQAAPLDSLLNYYHSRVSFIKIDVEGAELQVLLGAQEIINTSKPKLIIEIHHRKNDCRIRELLLREKYSIETVRHPFYPEGSPHWQNHYWIIAQ